MLQLFWMETDAGQRKRNAKKLWTYHGAKNVEVICKAAHDLGIEYVTMYAFSTENWNRPQNEVDALMKLLSSYLKNCIKTADKNNMRVRVIGDTSRLDDKFQQQIAVLKENLPIIRD